LRVRGQLTSLLFGAIAQGRRWGLTASRPSFLYSGDLVLHQEPAEGACWRSCRAEGNQKDGASSGGHDLPTLKTGPTKDRRRLRYTIIRIPKTTRSSRSPRSRHRPRSQCRSIPKGLMTQMTVPSRLGYLCGKMIGRQACGPAPARLGLSQAPNRWRVRDRQRPHVARVPAASISEGRGVRRVLTKQSQLSKLETCRPFTGHQATPVIRLRTNNSCGVGW